jgi:streptomycin 6-kinase
MRSMSDRVEKTAQRRAWLDTRALSLRSRVSPAVVAKFETAAAALDTYLDALQVQDIGPLTGSPLSPNVLRAVTRHDGTQAVLKLVGEPATGEIATLDAWTRAGVSCVPLLDSGVGTWSPEVTHMLLARVPGAPMTHRHMPSATSDIVRLLASAHLAPPPGVAALADELRPRLDTAEAIWRDAGLDPPSRVADQLAGIDGDRVLLHGDPVGMNLLVQADRAWLLDPAGVAGPVEFDAGRWVARCLAVASHDELGHLTSQAMLGDPTLRPNVLDACIAVELILEVRHRITSPDMFIAIGSDPATFDSQTRAMASTASRLLA